MGAKALSTPATATISTATPASGLSATAVVFAPPELVTTGQQEEVKDDTVQKDSTWRKKEGWGKKVKPPSMILDEDINGFKAQHKRRAGGGGGGRKGRKVCNSSLNLVSSLIFDAEQECPSGDMGSVGALRHSQAE
jgi:splicing factor 45